MDEYQERVDLTAKLQITEEGVEKVTKKFQEISQEILEDIEWKIKDDLTGWIADHVFRLYRDALEAMLAGNEDVFKRAIHAVGYTGRERIHVWTSGKIMLSGGMEIRQRLAETHEGILKDEVVKDLLAEKEALEARCGELEKRLEKIHG